MGYQAYPEYKMSRVKWLGKVPSHWNIERLRFSIQTNPTKSEIKHLSENLLASFVPMEAVGEWGGLCLDTQKEISEISNGYSYFADGDVLIAKITPCFENGKGAIAKALSNGIGFGTTELHILRCEKSLNRSYLFYLSISHIFREIGASQMLGAGGQKRVTDEFIRDFRVGLPSLPEQALIAEFLDHKTAQIDRLIEKKQELIKKLQEQRTTVFTQAMTKGLDSDVTLMDSGLEWLGEIPAHWKVAPLRRFIAKIEQGWSPSCEDRPATADEWAVLKSGCVNGGIFREGEHKTMPQELDPPLSLEVRPGDVLMCRASGSRHLIGSVAQVKECREKLIFSDKTYRITVDNNSLGPEFFTMAMSSKYMREQIELSISGAEGLANNIPQSLVKSYIFAVPSLEEQNRIVERLATFSESTEEREHAINEAITRLQEYRTALITAAVTGQIDVRNWQAPEPTKEPAGKEVA